MNIGIKIGIITITTLIGGFIGWYKSNSEITVPQYETVLFTTLTSSDPLSSVEEKETASHFFAEGILGWTLSPDFKNKLGFDISSRKQERANMIFEFTSNTEAEAEENIQQFINILAKKLSMYNTAAQTNFDLLLDDPVTTAASPHKSFWTLGGGIGGFFLGLFATELFIFFRRSKK